MASAVASASAAAAAVTAAARGRAWRPAPCGPVGKQESAGKPSDLFLCPSRILLLLHQLQMILRSAGPCRPRKQWLQEFPTRPVGGTVSPQDLKRDHSRETESPFAW